MARKATHKTSNAELIRDILDDQAAFMLSHLHSSDVRRRRIEHNLRFLFEERLGECLPANEPLYVE